MHRGRRRRGINMHRMAEAYREAEEDFQDLPGRPVSPVFNGEKENHTPGAPMDVVTPMNGAGMTDMDLVKKREQLFQLCARPLFTPQKTNTFSAFATSAAVDDEMSDVPRLEAAAGCGSGCGSGEAMPSSRVGSLPRLEQLRLQESSFGAHSPSTPASGLFDSPESRASGVWTPDAASPSEGDEQADDEADDDEGEAGGEQTGEEESKAPPTVQQSVRRLMKGVDDMAEAASWLQVAIVEGQVEVVEAIAASAPEALDKVGNLRQTALHYALHSGDASPEIVRVLLEHGPHLVDVCDAFARFPLHLAAIACSDDVIALVHAARPAAARVTDGHGDLPLHLYLERSNTKLSTTELLIVPHSLQARDRNGRLPLAIACTRSHVSAEVVLHLLSLFPDAIVDHVNSGGQPLLHQVVNSGLRCPEILQPLLDAVDSLDGAAEVQRSETGHNLLHAAVACNNPSEEAVTTLLEWDPELVEGVTKALNTPLHVAVAHLTQHSSDLGFLQALLHAWPGAAMAKNSANHTPLFSFCSSLAGADPPSVLRMMSDASPDCLFEPCPVTRLMHIRVGNGELIQPVEVLLQTFHRTSPLLPTALRTFLQRDCESKLMRPQAELLATVKAEAGAVETKGGDSDDSDDDDSDEGRAAGEAEAKGGEAAAAATAATEEGPAGVALALTHVPERMAELLGNNLNWWRRQSVVTLCEAVRQRRAGLLEEVAAEQCGCSGEYCTGCVGRSVATMVKYPVIMRTVISFL